MRFCIVIPTIRQTRSEFQQVQDALAASLTRPTELHVLDGAAGKAQTLNVAYRGILDRTEAEVYVTMDDDLLMQTGWQDVLERVWDRSPEWGALGLYLGDDFREYMGLEESSAAEIVGGATLVRASHVVGCLVAYPQAVAKAVGLIPRSPEKYQFWEDGWRGLQVRNAGYGSAYVVAPECTPGVVHYAGEEEQAYLREKMADVEASRPHVPEYLAMPGGSG